MSNRAYNLLRAYIGREWDRIEGAVGDARRELDDYLNHRTDYVPPQPNTTPAEDHKPEARKKQRDP